MMYWINVAKNWVKLPFKSKSEHVIYFLIKIFIIEESFSRALDSLVTKELLRCKTYGKHKIYYAQQNFNATEVC